MLTNDANEYYLIFILIESILVSDVATEITSETKAADQAKVAAPEPLPGLHQLIERKIQCNEKLNETKDWETG